MINKLKTFAIAMIATGATVATQTVQATPVTHTLTNVVQSVQITLTAYSNAVPSATGKTTLPVKPVTITTKTIIAALSNDSANIPSLTSFVWGKSPQLVLNTVFASSNVVTISKSVVASNTIAMTTTNGNALVFTAAVTNGTNTITITNTPASFTISNNAVGTTNGGTNLITATNNVLDTTNFVATNSFAFDGTNGALTNISFTTNVGTWTVVSAATNASGATNVTAVTFTNTSSSVVSNVISESGIQVQGGTATAPTFADVSDFIGGTNIQKSIIAKTGTGLGTSNEVETSVTSDAYGIYSITVFNTNASTAAGNNLNISLTGFVKELKKLDILFKSRSLTNQVTDETSTAALAGAGTIGGTFTTNTNVVEGLSISVPSTNEFVSTNAVTGGTITNVIPVVVSGTITVGAPKSIAE